MPNGPQLHLMLNHFPIIGFFLITPVVLLALLRGTTDHQRLALLGVFAIGLLALPAFWTGEPAEDVVKKLPGIVQDRIEEHEEAAEWGLGVSLTAAALAGLGWGASRRKPQLLKKATAVAFVASALASVTFARVGHLGGLIHHPEVTTGTK